MRRLAHFARRSPRLNLRTKTNGRVSENSAKLNPIFHRDRSIVPSDAWEVIANSLRIFDRELQIIQGIFDDQKEFAIADELTMSIHTVHTHLERLYRTLGVSSRVGLVLCILSEYLSSLPPSFKATFLFAADFCGEFTCLTNSANCKSLGCLSAAKPTDTGSFFPAGSVLGRCESYITEAQS